MIPYIIVFLIVLAFTYIAEVMLKKGNKNSAFFLMFLSILIMSVLAAVRNDEIGKDINTYVIPSFNWAIKYNFYEFMQIGNMENGYMTFTYIITKIFQDYHWILFFIQFTISILLYIFAYKKREELSMTLVLITYLLLMYNDTFTMMRQSISVFLIILSYITFSEKKYIKTILLFILGISFHSTSVISLLGYLIIIVNYSNKIKENNRTYINIVILLMCLVCIFFYKNILYFFTYTINLLPSKFYEYFNTKYYLDELQISKSILIFKIIWILISIMYNSIVKKDKTSPLIVMFLLIDIGIYVLSFKLGPLMRLGYYFSYPALLYLISKLSNMLKKDKFNKVFIYIITITFLLFYWYFNNILHNEGGNTYPYKSDIIRNILK